MGSSSSSLPSAILCADARTHLSEVAHLRNGAKTSLTLDIMLCLQNGSFSYLSYFLHSITLVILRRRNPC
jgi:hypothetical protein